MTTAVDGILLLTPLPAGVGRRAGRAGHRSGQGRRRSAPGQPGSAGSAPTPPSRRRRRWVGCGCCSTTRFRCAARASVVVGRSPVVGMPLALLLIDADATVTVCHSRSGDLARADARRRPVVRGGRPGRLDRTRAREAGRGGAGLRDQSRTLTARWSATCRPTPCSKSPARSRRCRAAPGRRPSRCWPQQTVLAAELRRDRR